ncbi:ribonuclease H-like domain-containing protein [Tanacetum coccineum]
MLHAFPVSLIGTASRQLRNQPSGSITTWEALKMKSTENSDGLAAIQAQLNNLRREIKKVNEKVYAAQRLTTHSLVHPINREDNIEQQGQDNGNSSYPDRRTNLEESLTKFMAESTKRHENNSNIIKEIRDSTDTAIRNQGASIKTLEIQIRQMSKVLQERGFRSLPSSTKTNPRDQVKSISTANADLSKIHRIREANEVKILEVYDHAMPQKEKDPGSFTLPCFIDNVCFDKTLVDLGASVSVMPFSTYTNLGLGILSHTRLTIKLADRTIKQPKGFTIINEDDVVKGVVLGMPFFKKYMSCQMIMKKFANGDENERIMDE